MSYPVHILVSDPKGDFGPGSRWVFDTLRVGFPTAKIECHSNALCEQSQMRLLPLLSENHGNCVAVNKTIHHHWIRMLVDFYDEPFWICDTDVVFWGSMEGIKADGPMVGRRIPEWRDEWSKCITRARIHPSLMLIDPVAFKAKSAEYLARFPKTEFNPHANLVNPMTVAFKGEGYFYDTLSMAYQAFGGKAFTAKELDLYDHMFFGTLQDLVLPSMRHGPELKCLREHTYRYPEKAKGFWRIQDEYFAQHPV